ncbi:HhoA/HhoB/HtrA family serine endopeptidase [Oscillatoria sp. FACHB-1406]|uniref:HhoA/HhoB/HtrA family serine endopeptidase n=1 Tax=Oscillatoria sp. FACHB-1406 TaxID=2692846 RepID=UPI001688149E|nr:HhoA/HhoB/HtrA family serine endopeptidase [Oscillatoria sp. FACHB-1406]MBD2578339.1 trypsin-like peptidase domain-containing protein [Oscillatoria sp. FACHB-1406]
MTKSLAQMGLYISLLILGGGIGVFGSRALAPKAQQTTQSVQPLVPATLKPSAVQPSTTPVETDNRLNFIARAVQKVGPAVVRIDASRTIDRDTQPPFSQPFFRRFFGEEAPIPQPRVQRGTGSGFILNSDGRLITNAHVVEGADRVVVTLKDGRELEGRVVGVDDVTDVAAVKIDAKELPTIKLGESEKAIPGEWAIAIGNPLGLDNTVTVGIISAIGRSSRQVGVPDKRVSFIQTDAAINPGNSGGPLLNANGEAIGMNTAIRADAQGLGFAIPIETAQRVANQLFAKGRADHPYLGIQMLDLSPELRKELEADPETRFKLDRDRGVVVVQVVPNSPAARAGLQTGDVIHTIAGKPIQESAEVQHEVERSAIGRVLAVEISRGGQKLTLQVKPGPFPARNNE